MPLKGKASFRTYTSKGVFTISTKVWQDSNFPFKPGETLEARINGEKVIISRKPDKGQSNIA